MNNRVLEQLLIGSTVALVTALINQAFAGQVNYLWVVLCFIVAIVIYWMYQGLSGFPFTKYHVTTNTEDGINLLVRTDVNQGRVIEQAYRFVSSHCDWAVYGPYMHQSLRKGKYRSTFRLRVDDVSGPNRPVVNISVASRTQERGDKCLAERTISTLDFEKADKSRDFTLDFYIISDERELELRVFARKSGHTVTLECIQLSRRLI